MDSFNYMSGSKERRREKERWRPRCWTPALISGERCRWENKQPLSELAARSAVLRIATVKTHAPFARNCTAYCNKMSETSRASYKSH